MAEKSDVISTGGVTGTGGLPARPVDVKRMRILQLHSKGWHPYVENKARDAATAARSGGRGPAALDSVCA